MSTLRSHEYSRKSCLTNWPKALFSLVFLALALACLWGEVPFVIGGPALIAFAWMVQREAFKRSPRSPGHS